MGQLNFANNFIHPANSSIGFSSAVSITFFGFNFNDSISLNTINLPLRAGATSLSLSLSLGLYSLNGASLSLANSGSVSSTMGAGTRGYRFISTFSATQNITPGTWFWGLLGSANTAGAGIYGQSQNLDANNAFPGAFIGGVMTDSTAAFPSSYATSDLDITGQDAMVVPNIIISA